MNTRRAQGQSLIEFALTFPLILLLVIVFIDLGRAFYYYSALTNAVREGARYGTVNQFGTNQQRVDKIRETVSGYSIAVPVQSNKILVYCDQNPGDLINPCDDYVTVSAEIDFEPITFFLAQLMNGSDTIQIRGESTMRMTPYGKYKE